MKHAIKRLVQAVLPDPLYASLTATSARRFIEKVEREQGLDALTKRYVAAHGRTVAGGPFQGMIYTLLSDHRHVGARMLGTYEREIAPAIDEFCHTPYEQVLDVGCAEGYYAVGLARRIPSARVIAFDTDPWARNACRELAALNGVSDRVDVQGFCSPARLQESLTGARALVMLDCEGYEAKLLDPVLAPKLRECDMIVELHDQAPSPHHPLVARFRETHEIELIPGVPRTMQDTALLDDFSPAEQLQLIDEMRHSWQGWAIFRRR